MDFLPLEMKLKIFNQLSIPDSIKCRQVCKNWLAIIDCLRYKSLNVSFLSSEQCRKNFVKKDTDLWILNFKKFFRSVTIDRKFRSVKVMNGLGHLTDVENLDVFINHFHELEELNLFSASKVEKFVLNLKFLKKIKFDQPSYKVKLETPSLTHLMTMRFSNFEICYPEQIKYLGVKNTSGITKFTNLEILIIVDYFADERTISQLSVDLLHQLPQLKRVYAGWNKFDKWIEQIPIERNSKLQVYYYGFRINSDSFGNFDWTTVKAETSNEGEEPNFIARNYSKSIDNNPYSFILDYTRLLDEFDQNIPNDFFKKISKLKSIKISNLDDEMKICKFLTSTKPKTVYIENPTLSRTFLEQLSKFSFIGRLMINIDEWPAFLNEFNFDFKNKKIHLQWEFHCSLKSLRPVFEVVERTKSIRLKLVFFCDEFKFFLKYSTLHMCGLFSIDYSLNDEHIYTCCKLESLDFLDFCFYLDKQVPSIFELKDKLRLFFIVKEYVAQKEIAGKVRRNLYWNPTISIKF